jgi:hypothetical protein
VCGPLHDHTPIEETLCVDCSRCPSAPRLQIATCCRRIQCAVTSAAEPALPIAAGEQQACTSSRQVRGGACSSISQPPSGNVTATRLPNAQSGSPVVPCHLQIWILLPHRHHASSRSHPAMLQPRCAVIKIHHDFPTPSPNLCTSLSCLVVLQTGEWCAG